jgi:thiol-disulfide isomerase/thioredoxin
LIAFVEQLESDMPDALADEIRFFRLEHSAINSDDADVALIDSCCEYLETQGEALDKRHLRLASSTVEMANELPSNQREAYFQRLSEALTISKTRDVARYGKRLAGKATGGKQLIGQELELTGITVEGNAFDIKHHREQVIVVDFWATWCGPCRKAHPMLAELAEQHEDLIIVGASLDADEAALAEYLETEEVAGITIFGKEAQQAAEDLGIRGIPTFLVVDPEGKIQAVTHNPEELDGHVADLLKTRLAEN